MAEICNQKNESTWELILKSVIDKDKNTKDKVILSSRNYNLKPHNDDERQHEH
jgi:hypothetical protein